MGQQHGVLDHADAGRGPESISSLVMCYGAINRDSKLIWVYMPTEMSVPIPPVPSGKAGRKGAGKEEKVLNEFAVEYAKSNRSTCKGCNQKIEKVQNNHAPFRSLD